MNWDIVNTINIDNTSVITNISVIEEALRHYSNIYKILPIFLLADNTDDIEDTCNNLEKLYRIRVLPLAQRNKIAQNRYCLFARPLWNIWQEGGLESLVRECHRHGIKSGYLVDAATVAPLPMRQPSPEHIKQRHDEICTIYNALADEESRQVFLGAIRSLMTGNPGYLPLSPYPQYEHPCVVAKEGDVVIDGGAYDGATTASFLEQVGPTGHVIAFEPLAQAHGLAARFVAHQNVTVEPYGLYSSAQSFYIENTGGSSCLSDIPSSESLECSSISLDTYCMDENIGCNLIKLDVEGVEPECLEGARNTISKFHPKLQISIYHKQSHYIDIPMYIIKNYPDYKLYMGHHSSWVWESCLYAI